jgi:glycolate oxidase FAD binding subunit
VSSLSLINLTGIIEYQPEEYTFTALAGTPVAEVEKLLAEHGQYLPFDPPLVGQGATLGGTVAAGLSGPGRQRYGGVRDFIIGLRFVDGQGQLVHGGGKVVKNAAGFDLPKLMVGSLGRLGVLVELTFKVFPGPAAYATLAVDYPHLETALTDIFRLNNSSLELYGLDLEPVGVGETEQHQNRPWQLWARLGGLPEAMPTRLERLREFLLSPKGGAVAAKVLEGSVEAQLWTLAKAFDWSPPGWPLIKVPVTLKQIPHLEAHLNGTKARRRYSAGGNIAWLAWPSPTNQAWRSHLNSLLTGLELSGLVISGPPGEPRLGVNPGAAFTRRIKQALDPAGRFLDL